MPAYSGGRVAEGGLECVEASFVSEMVEQRNAVGSHLCDVVSAAVEDGWDRRVAEFLEALPRLRAGRPVGGTEVVDELGCVHSASSNPWESIRDSHGAARPPSVPAADSALRSTSL